MRRPRAYRGQCPASRDLSLQSSQLGGAQEGGWSSWEVQGGFLEDMALGLRMKDEEEGKGLWAYRTHCGLWLREPGRLSWLQSGGERQQLGKDGDGGWASWFQRGLSVF